jgi:hypothetical protein
MDELYILCILEYCFMYAEYGIVSRVSHSPGTSWFDKMGKRCSQHSFIFMGFDYAFLVFNI